MVAGSIPAVRFFFFFFFDFETGVGLRVGCERERDSGRIDARRSDVLRAVRVLRGVTVEVHARDVT